MDFDLDDDLLALQAVVRRLCDDRFGPAVARRVGVSGLDTSRWSALADVGLLAVKEMGEVAACIAFEELGRALVAGPIVATSALAPFIPGAAVGERIVTAVAGDPGLHLVQHLDAADDVVRIDHDGVFVIAAAELEGTSVDALDPTANVQRVRVPAGVKVAGSDEAASALRTMSLLVSALLVGSAAATTDLAVLHALDRVQFGRPIGSFQAVKHLLADCYGRTEVARAGLHAAAVACADDGASGDIERGVAAARILAGNAGVSNARTALQVFGGMGFTWEVDVHLHLKRCWTLSSAFGSASAAASTVVDRVLA